jgi:Carboxypeptidase regulatory-like domain
MEIAMKRALLVTCLIVLAVAARAAAQGSQTGTISGTIQSTDGLSLPGVTVAVTSAALQGERAAVTDVNGVYLVRGLPSGVYTVRFTLQNFRSADKTGVELQVGGSAEVNTTMQLATQTETVTVRAASPTPLTTMTTSQAYSKREVDMLPVTRRPQDIAELAPGVTNNTPNANQVAISGGFAYDNVFLLDGVDIDDNLFAQPNNLYVEDALQQTNVLVGGISAEYGRFTGGVINLVTKSGGNSFSGSFRENFSKPSWISNTPFEDTNNVEHSKVLGKFYEGTGGGPIVRERLWFFTAGRYESSNTANTFTQVGTGYTTHNLNKRGQLKFTGTITPGQTLSGAYLKSSSANDNLPSLSVASSLDASVLINRQSPADLLVANYNGVLGSLFATVQYSHKHFGLRNAGGTSTAIADSPIRTLGTVPGVPSALLYNAPFFSAHDPEDRDNRQITGSVAHTTSTRRFGTHDLKGGVEYYVSTHTGGNSQSATNYVFQTDYLLAGSKPALDSRAVPIPVFMPGTSRLQNWLATLGARTDIKTNSLYFQDRWLVTPKLTVTLGTRFEVVRGDATGDLTTVDTTTWVPRLGASYDLQGNGKTIVSTTYAHYAGKYNEAQFGANTPVGNPSRITWAYTGPAGQGIDFAPGLNPGNYSTFVSASFPTANIFAGDGLSSPVAREWTFGLGRELGERAFVKAVYTQRSWHDFVENFIDLSNGITTPARNGVSTPAVTNVVYKNANGWDSREYRGLTLQSDYRMRGDLVVSGHYTVQLRNNGTFAGEAANVPGSSPIYADYPEVWGPAIDRYQPDGRLYDFQRHKLRAYAIYSPDFGRFGSMSVSPLWRVNSGQVFSYIANSYPITAIELARNPGYPDISASNTAGLYFGDRGAGEFKGYGVLDFSATYNVPVWRTVRPWVKMDIFNVANNGKQIAWNTTITADANSPRDANGLPTGYIQSPLFGQASADNQFPQPFPGQNGGRAVKLSIGVRF